MPDFIEEIPYYCQWESAHAAGRIIRGEMDVAEDPMWVHSGAGSREEYALWADHVCGMACLKMILAARTGEVHGTVALAKIGVEFGAYVVENGDIRGMIYAPFVEMIRARFGIIAEVVTEITAADLCRVMQPGSLFLASVHPTIRLGTPPPPKRGGHLVLVTGLSSGDVVFHNPSGHDVESRVDARMALDAFDAFFAGRGVLVHPPRQGVG